MTFPGANHTFSVQRLGGPTLVGQNYVLGAPIIALRGVSIQLKPLMGLEVALESGVDSIGKYIGSCDSGTGIRNQDIILDELSLNNDGTPVSYTVMDSFDNSIYLRLFLHQKSKGG